jgi:8-oxo-dGTP pyrophosphatase MutT (NUDIX family)
MDERIEISAGGVVYRRVAGEIEVAIAEQRDRVTATLTTRLPKGKIESGETAEEAAVREVAEEVGLWSRVVGDLGSVRYVYGEPAARVSKQVHYFLMEWVPGEPLELDGEMERVYWCSIAEAERTLTFETEQRVMSRVQTQLETRDCS